MKPHIDRTVFGCITINGQEYEHDTIIRLDGSVDKRNKKLSKLIFGNSHKMSKKEAQFIFQEGAEYVVIGTGHYGELELSEEARSYFENCHCRVEAMNTKKAIVFYNEFTGDKVIAIFHVTC